MKKTLLVVLFVMLAASMFAADLSVSLDAGLMIDKTGLNYRTPSTEDESEYTASLSVAYDGESFGGHFELRNETQNAPYSYGAFSEVTYLTTHKNTNFNYFFARNYGVYVKPCQEVKLAIDSGAVELLVENISWEPLFAASLFEHQSSPSFIVTWDVDSHLQVIAGVNTSLKDSKKPWTGLGVMATYEVFGLGKFIAKYESLDEKYVAAGATWDAGLAFQLLALDTQDVYAGYSLIMDKANPVQHRIEAFYGLNLDALSISLFDSFELRTIDGLKPGNRTALKVAYYLENITPSLEVNFYHNFNVYSGRCHHLWGGADVGGEECTIIDIDPRIDFAFGQGTLSTGARLTYNFTAASDKFSWYIPLGITVSF